MPRRRCVGCGRIAPKAELLRIAASAIEQPAAGKRAPRLAVLDERAVMPGRGAYLCRACDAHSPSRPHPDCLRRANHRGGIARALRSAVTLDHELVESVIPANE